MNQAIYPIHEKQTRREKRGFKREAEKIEPLLIDLETKFEFSIFKAPNHLTYQQLYEHFNDKWIELINQLLIEYDLKYAIIDIHHFPRMYKAKHKQKI